MRVLEFSYDSVPNAMAVKRSTKAPHAGPSPQILRALLRLREMIVTGELPASRRVPELQLVQRVGVSRTPLRLAMEQLAHEGLLVRRATGGFVVREFTPREIRDAIELRGALEGTAARLGAERGLAAEEREQLFALVEASEAIVSRAAETLPNFQDYLDANDRFHRRLVELSGNSWLQGVMAQVTSLPFASPNAFVLTQATSSDARRVLTIAQEHHRAIADAIAGRDGSRAEALAREHARLALRYLDSVMRDRERFGRLPGAALVRL
jgi:GntR family transcriptional regulator of vanillate catabolism